jgi:hypothetical protein
MKFRQPNSLAKVKLIALIIFIFSQIYFLAIHKHECLDLDISPNTIVAPALFGNNVVGQSFIAKNDGLARIDLIFTTYQRKNDRDIIFRLFQLKPRRMLVEKVFNASSLKDNLYQPIRFKPQKNVKGKKLFFELLSPAGTLDNCVAIWMNHKNIYREGEYLFKRSPEKGDLVFRVYSRRPIVTELGRVLKSGRGFFGNLWALVIAMIFFEAALCHLFVQLIEFILYSLKAQG